MSDGDQIGSATVGRLEGKRALVTGGGSGIGAATVERFRAEGAQVLSADLRGGDIECDVRSREAVRAAVAETVDRLGGLDTLVLNAGRPVVGLLHELPQDEWDDGVATNLTSIYLFVQEAWEHLAAAGRSSITLTASVVGLWGSQNQAAYCMTKAGVVMLAKCLALDGANAGIRCNCVCPGFIETPLLENFISAQPDPGAVRKGAVGLHPMGRLGKPLDIADGFVWLSSDDAEWVTGIALTVDGGLTAGIYRG